MILLFQDLRFRSLLMTDLKKVLFLYRQSNSSTPGVDHGEGSKLVEEWVEENKDTSVKDIKNDNKK